MFAAHAIELKPHAEPAECDQSDKRETGRDYKSELWRERKRSDHACDRDGGEHLTAQTGCDRIARHAQERMRVGRRGWNHHVFFAAQPTGSLWK